MNSKKISTVLLLATIVLGTKLPSVYGMDRQYIPLEEWSSIEEENVPSSKKSQPSTQKEREEKNQKKAKLVAQKKKIEAPIILDKAKKLHEEWAHSLSINNADERYMLCIGNEEKDFNKKYKQYTGSKAVKNAGVAKAANRDPDQKLIQLAANGDDDLYIILLRAKEDSVPGLKKKLQEAKVKYFIQKARDSHPALQGTS